MIFIVEWARTADGGRVRVGVGRVRFQWGRVRVDNGARMLSRGRVGVGWVRLDFGLVILESERCILVTN